MRESKRTMYRGSITMNVNEFFCVRCNSKNVGKFVIHTDEVIKNAIKKNNDMMWSDFEKDQNSFMILKDEIESQYVICELCNHKNYFPLYMGAPKYDK